MTKQQFHVAVIEDRYDPLKLGRYRVRVFGAHNENIVDVPVNKLPWAIPLSKNAGMSGIGLAPNFVEGTLVYIFFQDGESKQQPIILGAVAGVPVNKLTFPHGSPILEESMPLGNYPESVPPVEPPLAADTIVPGGGPIPIIPTPEVPPEENEEFTGSTSEKVIIESKNYLSAMADMVDSKYVKAYADSSTGDQGQLLIAGLYQRPRPDVDASLYTPLNIEISPSIVREAFETVNSDIMLPGYLLGEPKEQAIFDLVLVTYIAYFIYVGDNIEALVYSDKLYEAYLLSINRRKWCGDGFSTVVSGYLSGGYDVHIKSIPLYYNGNESDLDQFKSLLLAAKANNMSGLFKDFSIKEFKFPWESWNTSPTTGPTTGPTNQAVDRPLPTEIKTAIDALKRNIFVSVGKHHVSEVLIAPEDGRSIYLEYDQNITNFLSAEDSKNLSSDADLAVSMRVRRTYVSPAFITGYSSRYSHYGSTYELSPEYTYAEAFQKFGINASVQAAISAEYQHMAAGSPITLWMKHFDFIARSKLKLDGIVNNLMTYNYNYTAKIKKHVAEVELAYREGYITRDEIYYYSPTLDALLPHLDYPDREPGTYTGTSIDYSYMGNSIQQIGTLLPQSIIDSINSLNRKLWVDTTATETVTHEIQNIQERYLSVDESRNLPHDSYINIVAHVSTDPYFDYNYEAGRLEGATLADKAVLHTASIFGGYSINHLPANTLIVNDYDYATAVYPSWMVVDTLGYTALSTANGNRRYLGFGINSLVDQALVQDYNASVHQPTPDPLLNQIHPLRYSGLSVLNLLGDGFDYVDPPANQVLYEKTYKHSYKVTKHVAMVELAYREGFITRAEVKTYSPFLDAILPEVKHDGTRYYIASREYGTNL